MDLFVIVLFLILILLIVLIAINSMSIFTANKNKYYSIPNSEQHTLNQLSTTVNTLYGIVFDNPQNTQVARQYDASIDKLVTFITEHEYAIPHQTYAIIQKKISDQQQAVLLHDSYLEQVAMLYNEPTNNLLLTTWLNDGAALSAHLKASALENASHFAATHVLHIADIRRERYQHALNALKRNPTNPDLHTHALQMGREYAESTRAEGVVTLFDETALANDIRAVTANAAQVSTIDNTQARPAQAASLDERIAALLKLKAAGLLSDAEFEQKRQELIDAV